MAPDRYLTPEQVGELLQVDERLVRQLCINGELRGRKIGRQWRIAESAVEEFMRSDEPEARRRRAVHAGLTERSAARMR